ncbi:MAG: hypothetical protein ACRDO4_02680 [Nocardioides sp.]
MSSTPIASGLPAQHAEPGLPSTTAGNLATEDLLWMLTGLGIETGVDLDATLRAGRAVTRLLGRPAPSRVVQALTDTGTEREAKTP